MSDEAARYDARDDEDGGYRVVDRAFNGATTTIDTFAYREDAEWHAQMLNAQHDQRLAEVEDRIDVLVDPNVWGTTWETARDPISGELRPTEIACEVTDRFSDNCFNVYARPATPSDRDWRWFRVGSLNPEEIARVAAPSTDAERELEIARGGNVERETVDVPDRGPAR